MGGGCLNVPGDRLAFPLQEVGRDYCADLKWTRVTETITLLFGHYTVRLRLWSLLRAQVHTQVMWVIEEEESAVLCRDL